MNKETMPKRKQGKERPPKKRNLFSREKTLSHVDSGQRCLVYHYDGQGSCIICSTCGEHIRPMDWKKSVCSGEKEQIIKPMPMADITTTWTVSSSDGSFGQSIGAFFDGEERELSSS